VEVADPSGAEEGDLHRAAPASAPTIAWFIAPLRFASQTAERVRKHTSPIAALSAGRGDHR